jgi:hypothetical protein
MGDLDKYDSIQHLPPRNIEFLGVPILYACIALGVFVLGVAIWLFKRRRRAEHE